MWLTTTLILLTLISQWKMQDILCIIAARSALRLSSSRAANRQSIFRSMSQPWAARKYPAVWMQSGCSPDI
ncbi:uncharacterized protein F4817DRAFT_345615 [Daldinia loculata]|uniref:uncharacterized protein n=1 Tax=Daldinia loculata TaxID=103429 RepID=UPI0020C4AB92|nr:uncharacterized protein F4817DRAFT_345615 [Daldinia loculata]KAI1644752.1 hypothetical protein F4817DRAFT_345615 [Daldinia loculata]